ncbi:MAG: phospholipid carrier-dependent glycosyltransferase [Pyrinomonadaceae bacterium]
MSTDIVTTASINPGEYFRESGVAFGRLTIACILGLLVIGGFLLRTNQLSDESLGEDEWKKLETVEEYRTNGLTGANGEHPFLLKGMLTVSVSAAGYWNLTTLVQNSPSLFIPVESAVRFPVTLFGAFSAILIFLIASMLFGQDVGLIAAAMWAFDPSGIGLARIAKEDVVMTFFIMLSAYFLLKGQIAAENGEGKWAKWMWAAAVAYGALMATKYMPHFLAILTAYYFVFQGLPAAKWRFGQKRWFVFLVILGVSFLLFNPTILLPDTWRQIAAFVSENRVGYKVESSYEYMGHIYRNKLSLWFFGIPWHFFYVFILVKLPVTTIAGTFAGVVLMFRKQLGDGRYFVFWWCFFWFMPFSILGGKFTRYFAFALPIVHIISAVGVAWFARKLSELFTGKNAISSANRNGVFASLLLIAAIVPLAGSLRAMPHYRLFTNIFGGGMQNAGYYFPHDEFFDARLGETAKVIAANAPPNARVYSETARLMDFQLHREGRDDIESVWLSDPFELAKMRFGDIVIDARGRRYLSNFKLLDNLNSTSKPFAKIDLGPVPAVKIFTIDDSNIEIFRRK